MHFDFRKFQTLWLQRKSSFRHFNNTIYILYIKKSFTRSQTNKKETINQQGSVPKQRTICSSAGQD